MIKYIPFSIFLFLHLFSYAQEKKSEKVELLKWGDFENWTVRYIKESKLLGGKIRTVYIPAITDTVHGIIPFQYGGSTTNWTGSNTYANIAGIVKASNTVFPERRGTGHCAKLQVQKVEVKVFGMINIQVVVQGTLYFGRTLEPIRDQNEPYRFVDFGIPFSRKPKALMLDIKSYVSENQTYTKMTGFGRSELPGHDEPEIFVFLQKRWEDNHGTIFAKRIGTARVRIEESIPQWKDDFRIQIHYGDISKRPDFKPYQDLMCRNGSEFQAMNSKGKMVLIQENQWGSESETPTHLCLMFTSGFHPAFYGTIGNTLWIDNVRFVY